MSLQKIKYYGLKDIDNIPQLKKLSEEERFDIKVVSNIFPFRVNNYVTEELIDWDNYTKDPVFHLTFMQKDMLNPTQFDQMANVISRRSTASTEEITQIANSIRSEFNEHPAGQMTANIPTLEKGQIPGVQHKYNETILIFPSHGQMCHSYCTYCFRWPQFIGMKGVKFATDPDRTYLKYIQAQKQVTDVLLTGGDPMTMSANLLKSYIEPLLSKEYSHITNIRIGTKALAWWPYRFSTDKDAHDTLRLFEKVKAAGKEMAIMAHFSHYQEMETDAVKTAIENILNTGAQIRTQSPIVRNVNDNSAVWEKMWREQVRMGMIPYYMFVARDTGAQDYFSVSLAQAQKIFHSAYSNSSGLARTVRGPSMSAYPGKVCVEGTAMIDGEQVFVLNFLQARNPDWVKRPFFAKYDETAIWLDDLRPAFNEKSFFFEKN